MLAVSSQSQSSLPGKNYAKNGYGYGSDTTYLQSGNSYLARRNAYGLPGYRSSGYGSSGSSGYGSSGTSGYGDSSPGYAVYPRSGSYSSSYEQDCPGLSIALLLITLLGIGVLFYILYTKIVAAGRRKRGLEDEQWWYILHMEEIILSGRTIMATR